MDLRRFHVGPSISQKLTRLADGGVSFYQPFIFSDQAIVGVAAMWNANQKRYICTEDDTLETQAKFLRESERLGEWYNYLNSVFIDAFPAAKSFFDFGANLGHFGFDLVRNGKEYTAVERERNRAGYSLIRDITGLELEYIGTDYDENSHRLVSCPDLPISREWDFGIFSSVLLHLCDPHYALPYLTQNIRQGIFYSTLQVPGDFHHFMARMPTNRAAYPLPKTFELLPTEPLAESMLRFAGFSHIYKLPYVEGRNPRNTRQWWCWIAARQPIAERAIDVHELDYVSDRTAEFVDRHIDGYTKSIPTIR